MFEYLKNKLISDFIKTELSNKSMLNDMLLITECENILMYEYECNQYNVELNRLNNMVVVKDIVSEENGVPVNCTRVRISITDFLEILKSSIE